MNIQREGPLPTQHAKVLGSMGYSGNRNSSWRYGRVGGRFGLSGMRWYMEKT
jgi:hypothetical protein